MFYMIWTPGDYPDSFSWFTCVGTKAKAMKEAAAIASERGLKTRYIRNNQWQVSLVPDDLADPKLHVLIIQTDWYYHGA